MTTVRPLVAADVFKPADAVAHRELDRTDAAVARAFAHEHADELRFDHRLKLWRYFDQPRWRVDDTGEALRRLQAFQERCATSR